MAERAVVARCGIKVRVIKKTSEGTAGNGDLQ